MAAAVDKFYIIWAISLFLSLFGIIIQNFNFLIGIDIWIIGTIGFFGLMISSLIRIRRLKVKLNNRIRKYNETK